jgi:hypothetical protein
MLYGLAGLNEFASWLGGRLALETPVGPTLVVPFFPASQFSGKIPAIAESLLWIELFGVRLVAEQRFRLVSDEPACPIRFIEARRFAVQTGSRSAYSPRRAAANRGRMAAVTRTPASRPRSGPRSTHYSSRDA